MRTECHFVQRKACGCIAKDSCWDLSVFNIFWPSELFISASATFTLSVSRSQAPSFRCHSDRHSRQPSAAYHRFIQTSLAWGSFLGLFTFSSRGKVGGFNDWAAISCSQKLAGSTHWSMANRFLHSRISDTDGVLLKLHSAVQQCLYINVAERRFKQIRFKIYLLTRREFGLGQSAWVVQSLCNKQVIHKAQNVCSLWPHIFLKNFKIIPWRIWAWIHFKPWYCLRGGQQKDMCQKTCGLILWALSLPHFFLFICFIYKNLTIW